MNVRCRGCGKSFAIAGESGLCPACGTRAHAEHDALDENVADASAPEVLADPGVALPRKIRRQAAPIDLPPPPVEEEPQENARVVWIVAGIALLLIGGLIALIISMHRGGEKASTETLPSSPSTIPVAVAPPPTTSPVAPPPPLPEAEVVAVAPTPEPQPAPATTETSPPTSSPAPRFSLDPAPAPPPAGVITDTAINDSIQRGVDYLIKTMRSGEENTIGSGDMQDGVTALCTFALLHCGQAIKDQRLSIFDPYMRGLIDRLKTFPMDGHSAVYARSIRVTALALYNRKEDRSKLEEDVAWLLKKSRAGKYGYPEMPEWWDNSCGQYGALGVWAGADAGIRIQQQYWVDLNRHWTKYQSKDGGWSYRGEQNSTLSMTCAGVTTLFVAADQLSVDRATSQFSAQPFSPALTKGLKWLAESDRAISLPEHWRGYALYGIERAGLASGFKFFGEHDWYRELAQQTMARQDDDGSWPGEQPLVDTSFSLLFLSRGRHPILMNKLYFPGSWSNRPRDMAHLSKFVGKEMERPLNWQVVSLDSDWWSWLDAPILYIASHEPLKFSDDDCTKLRLYAMSGGLILTQTDADNKSFNMFAEDLAKKLFPQFPMQDVPANHPIYSAMYPTDTTAKLRGVSNGVRLLMVHSPTDLPHGWQLNETKTFANEFRTGANFFVYATGKDTLRNRLQTLYVPRVLQAPRATVPLARLKYKGNWDPEPEAWPRFARWFQRETSIALQIKETDVASLRWETAPLAHLTAVTSFNLTESEISALREFVKAGGVLLIDPCGGKRELAQALRNNVVVRIDPTAKPQMIRGEHSLLDGRGKGMSVLSKPAVRPFTIEANGAVTPYFDLVNLGEGAIIISDLDLTSGLLGSTTWGIAGYTPDYALAFIKNAVLWSAARPVPTSASP